jgi:hypothetical protein
VPTPIEIDIEYHSVVIERTRVPRPAGISVTDWVRLWESVKRGGYESGYSDGYAAGLEHFCETSLDEGDKEGVL